MMKNKILAVFDLDGTLTSNSSLEKSFARFTYREGMLSFRSILLHGAYFVAMAAFDRTAAVKRNKYYLRGITDQKLKAAAKAFVSRYKHKLMAEYALPLLESHRNLGHINILVTGSLEPLVNELVMQLKLPFDIVFSTRLKSNGSLLTGKIEGPHFYGDSKTVLVNDLALRTGADLAASFCYADSISDLNMMQRFGHPVAVRPDKKLAEIALQHGWKVI